MSCIYGNKSFRGSCSPYARMCQTKPGSDVKVFTFFPVLLCTSCWHFTHCKAVIPHIHAKTMSVPIRTIFSLKIFSLWASTLYALMNPPVTDRDMECSWYDHYRCLTGIWQSLLLLFKLGIFTAVMRSFHMSESSTSNSTSNRETTMTSGPLGQKIDQEWQVGMYVAVHKRVVYENEGLWAECVWQLHATQLASLSLTSFLSAGSFTVII